MYSQEALHSSTACACVCGPKARPVALPCGSGRNPPPPASPSRPTPPRPPPGLSGGNALCGVLHAGAALSLYNSDALAGKTSVEFWVYGSSPPAIDIVVADGQVRVPLLTATPLGVAAVCCSAAVGAGSCMHIKHASTSTLRICEAAPALHSNLLPP